MVVKTAKKATKNEKLRQVWAALKEKRDNASRIGMESSPGALIGQAEVFMDLDTMAFLPLPPSLLTYLLT